MNSRADMKQVNWRRPVTKLIRADQEVIRKAVEQADGFDLMPEWDDSFYMDDCWDETSTDFDDPDQRILDALAAQLVRQVDAIVTAEFMSNLLGSFVTVMGKQTRCIGPDRTMNTLRCITEWGGLE